MDIISEFLMTKTIGVSIISVVGIISAVLICFAGYRLFRFMLLYLGFGIGFFIGALMGVFSENPVILIMFGIIFGAVISVVFYKFRDAAVIVVSAVLATAIIYYLIGSVVISVVFGIVAAVLSTFYVRYTFVTVTSLFGAGLLLVSVCFIMGMKSLIAPIYILWLIIGLSGILCQLLTTYDLHKYYIWKVFMASIKKDNFKMTFSEKKYPGMQRAYRNFCINCGCELLSDNSKCPRCKFEIKD